MVEEKYLDIFKDEASSHLSTLERCVLDIESKGISPELIKEGMRSAHTIKGSARLLGLEEIGKIAHRIEDIFKELDSGKPLSTEIINEILKGIDSIKKLISGEKKEVEVEEKPKEEIKKTFEVLRIPRDKVESIIDYATELFIQKIKLKGKIETYEVIKKELREEIAEYLKGFLPEEKIKPITEKVSSVFYEITEDFKNTYEEISSIVEGIHQTSLFMRFIPFSEVADELRRIARDTAEEGKKKIKFSIRGGETELDKVDLDKIKPALIHLIRNAVDHGIESSDLRRSLNKSEEGLVEVSVEMEGENIKISVRDDGAGINLDKLVERAIEKGLIDRKKAEGLTENEKVALMFEHGISTKEKVTEISGRGVGMDVVKAIMFEMRGDVRVETHKNKGTKISLVFPRTSFTIKGIKVTDNEEAVIPVNDVIKIVRVKKEEVLFRDSDAFIEFNKKPIPVKPLAFLLNFENFSLFDGKDFTYVLILKGGERIFGIKVSDFTSDEEHIIKSPSALLEGMKLIAGITLSKEGLPIIVLNINDLADMFFAKMTPKIAEELKERKKKILLVEDSITTLMIEKNILELAGFDVDTAIHGGEALKMINSKTYDLFVLDIQMPVLDGIELTKIIRSNPLTSKKPVVIVSSITDEKEMRKAKDAGADVYISKRDFDKSGFLRVVKDYLEK
jgi:two-component system chemotaxis sensor kinase CheA